MGRRLLEFFGRLAQFESAAAGHGTIVIGASAAYLYAILPDMVTSPR